MSTFCPPRVTIVLLIAQTDSTDLDAWAHLASQTGETFLCYVDPANLPTEILPQTALPNVDQAFFLGLRAHFDMLCKTGIIGIDSADYLTVLRSAGPLRISFGLGNISKAAGVGAQALASLQGQGVGISSIRGIWVTIFAGPECTLDLFDQISSELHETISHETDVIVGLLLAEEFAGRVLVSVVAG